MEGEIIFDGKNILKMNNKELQNFRGNRISMIFQDPMTSLNPVYTIGNQIMESIMVHRKMDKKMAKKESLKAS